MFDPLMHAPAATARTLLLLSVALLVLYVTARAALTRRTATPIGVNAADFTRWALDHRALPQRVGRGTWQLTADELRVPDGQAARDVGFAALMVADATRLSQDDPTPLITETVRRFQVTSGALGLILTLLALAGVPLTLLPGVTLWGASVVAAGMRAAGRIPSVMDAQDLIADSPLSGRERQLVWQASVAAALLTSLEVGPGFFSWRQALLR